MTTTRRIFMLTVAATGAALTTQFAVAQAAMVKETDPQAAALGYYVDTTKVDAKKYPKHAATQMCSNCALYAAGKPVDAGAGKPAEEAGGCPLFAGKQVAGKAWCSAYAKKG